MSIRVLAKLGQFSVKHVQGQKDGQEYSFYALEKRYFVKDKDQWEGQTIRLKTDEMAAVAALCQEAVCAIAKEEAMQANIKIEKSQQGGSAPINDEPPF